jgi:hypothetical protein
LSQIIKIKISLFSVKNAAEQIIIKILLRFISSFHFLNFFIFH